MSLNRRAMEYQSGHSQQTFERSLFALAIFLIGRSGFVKAKTGPQIVSVPDSTPSGCAARNIFINCQSGILLWEKMINFHGLKVSVHRGMRLPFGDPCL
jgi:hypothetical protein